MDQETFEQTRVGRAWVSTVSEAKENPDTTQGKRAAELLEMSEDDAEETVDTLVSAVSMNVIKMHKQDGGAVRLHDLCAHLFLCGLELGNKLGYSKAFDYAYEPPEEWEEDE